jgi:hypothetical protein
VNQLPAVPSYVWQQPYQYKLLGSQLIAQLEMDAHSDATVLMTHDITLKTLLFWNSRGTNVNKIMAVGNELLDPSRKASTALSIPLPCKMW